MAAHAVTKNPPKISGFIIGIVRQTRTSWGIYCAKYYGRGVGGGMAAWEKKFKKIRVWEKNEKEEEKRRKKTNTKRGKKP